MSPRERLIEAAIVSLQERGYARTTTRQIVALAELHLPAVNYYFGSKERLLQEAIVEAIRRWGERTMVASERPVGSPWERLRLSLQRFLETLEADRAYVVAAAEAFAQAERDPELRERLALAYEEFRGVVSARIQQTVGFEAGAPHDLARALSSTLIALFDGLAMQTLLDPGRTPDVVEVTRSLALLGQLAAMDATVQP